MSKQEEEYQAYWKEREDEEIGRLLSYQDLKESLSGRAILRTSQHESLMKILDLCAKLVVAETWDYEEIIGEIEEELR